MAKSSTLKIAAVIVVASLVILGALAAYVYINLGSLQSVINRNRPAVTGAPEITSSISVQNLLLYSNSSQMAPYALLNFTSSNATSIYANVTLFASPIPRAIYFLQSGNECFDCGNLAEVQSALAADLTNYSIIASPSQLLPLQISDLAGVQNDSIIVISSGLMPSEMLDRSGSNSTLLQNLMDRGVSIVYVGQDFSRALLPGSIVISTTDMNLSGYLITTPTTYPKASDYYSNYGSYSFVNGSKYGPTTYVNVLNGSIVAFPNYPNAWSSPVHEAHDLAIALRGMFWLRKLATGYSVMAINASANQSGSIGVVMSDIPFNYSIAHIRDANAGTFRAIVSATSSLNGKNVTAYNYAMAKPSLSLNGTMSMPTQAFASKLVPVEITIFTHSTTPITIQPHIDIYDKDLRQVTSIPLPYASAAGNFTFLKYLTFNIMPGKYLAVLRSFGNLQYTAAYFDVPAVNVSLIRANLSSGTFTFYVSTNGQPLESVPYEVSVNNLYQSNGTMNNGTIVYSLPRGTPVINGNLNFSISMLSGRFYYNFNNAPVTFAINKEYIEIAIVSIIVLLMVVLVRAPNRDEFYIDVPVLPEQKKTPIKLKAKEILAAFDKLNASYHWKFMPLSKADLKSAIANNLRYGNIPVNLTYGNIDSILTQLGVNGHVVSVDNLYMPSSWSTASGHDVGYLAAFKKLRLYLVTHGYVFTDLDTSNTSDIVATLHGERKYIVIYSKTSKFMKVPIYANSTTYLVFLNSYKLEEFRDTLYSTTSNELEELKLYISAGDVKLVDADNPGEAMG